MSIEHKARFPLDLMCLQLESMKVIKKCKIRLKNNMVVIRPNKNIMKKSLYIILQFYGIIYQQTYKQQHPYVNLNLNASNISIKPQRDRLFKINMNILNNTNLIYYLFIFIVYLYVL